MYVRYITYSTVERLDKEHKALKYKAIDNEARQRRNNIVFFNVPEKNNEEDKETVETFLKDSLKMQSTPFIQRAHRLGTPKPGKKRPIIACFRDFPEVNDILSRGKKLQNTGLGMARDLPAELRLAQAKLQPLRREARSKGKLVKVVYPAKIIIDGKMTKDLFPDWNLVLPDMSTMVLINELFVNQSIY